MYTGESACNLRIVLLYLAPIRKQEGPMPAKGQFRFRSTKVVPANFVSQLPLAFSRWEESMRNENVEVKYM